VACIFDMSGLEARGTGGGAPFLVDEGLGSLPLTPFVVPWPSALFMPKERADLAGIGGGCSDMFCLGASAEACRVGLLGGSAGIVGGGATSTAAACGLELVDLDDSLAFSASL
jgi:hypothetical protein